MTDKTMTLENGKYTLIRLESGGMEALRYGSRWRDLTGDKLVLALAQRIDELESQPAERGEAVTKAFCFMPSHIVDSVNANLRQGSEAVFTAYTAQHDPLDVPLYTAPPPAAGVPELWKDAPDDNVRRRAFGLGWNACRAAMLSATPSPTIDVAGVRQAIDHRILAAFKAIGEWAGPNLTAAIARAIGDTK